MTRQEAFIEMAKGNLVGREESSSYYYMNLNTFEVFYVKYPEEPLKILAVDFSEYLNDNLWIIKKRTTKIVFAAWVNFYADHTHSVRNTKADADMAAIARLQSNPKSIRLGKAVMVSAVRDVELN